MQDISIRTILFFMQMFVDESSFARAMINIIRAKEKYDPHPHPEDAFKQPERFRLWAYCKCVDECSTDFFIKEACRQKKVNDVVFSISSLFSELTYEDEEECGPFNYSWTPNFVYDFMEMLEKNELAKIYTKKELGNYHRLQKKTCKFLSRKTGFHVYKTESENRDEFAFDLSPILDK